LWSGTDADSICGIEVGRAYGAGGADAGEDEVACGVHIAGGGAGCGEADVTGCIRRDARGAGDDAVGGGATAAGQPRGAVAEDVGAVAPADAARGELRRLRVGHADGGEVVPFAGGGCCL